MSINVQAVFVRVIIITVLTSFLASQLAGANSLKLLAGILDPFKAVFEANRGVSIGRLHCPSIPTGIELENEVGRQINSAKPEVVGGEEGQRGIATTLAVTGNLHLRGHPSYPPLGCN